MSKNLNLVEILKDCPQGTKLYSTIFGEVEFEKAHTTDYPITFKYKDKDGCCLRSNVTKDGRFSFSVDGECTLFPAKDQRDWSKFKVEPEMIDGEIYYCSLFNKINSIYIHRKTTGCKTEYYVKLELSDLGLLENGIITTKEEDIKELRKATEEEMQQLLNTIKRDGYKWNEKKKELVKAEPKFDKIKDLHLESLDKAYNAGYNDAMQNALKWLEICLQYHDCGDYSTVALCDDTIEDAIERFKKDNSLEN